MYEEEIKSLEIETDLNGMGIITRKIYAHLIYLLMVYFTHQFVKTHFWSCGKVKRAASSSIPTHTQYMCLN